MDSGIYKIVNLQTGKYYVGSTKDFTTRKQSHFSRLKNNNHTNKHLQSAYNKYGIDNFKFEIIEYVQKELLLDIEQSYIDDSEKENIYNKTYIAGAGGYDTLSIPIYLLDLNGNIINEFNSIMDCCRNLKIARRDSRFINTDSKIKSKYRLVSKEFYKQNIDVILKWKNYTREHEEKGRLYLLRQQVVVTKDNITIEFNTQKEAGNYLGISRERVRQILKSSSKKFEIRYKYPELQ